MPVCLTSLAELLLQAQIGDMSMGSSCETVECVELFAVPGGAVAGMV